MSIEILVVDDDALVLRGLQRALNVRGWGVTVVQSATEAIATLGERTFDAIVCDVEMPDGDGSSVLWSLRKVSSSQAERFLFHTSTFAHMDSWGVPIVRKGDIGGLYREIRLIVSRPDLTVSKRDFANEPPVLSRSAEFDCA